ncbi:MAG: hypothetical protein BGO65_02580 [Afipia sp. 64-13]|nr:MAG: hypothetical protein BGO65_02580 [Afipia sp. 64-13]
MAVFIRIFRLGSFVALEDRHHEGETFGISLSGRDHHGFESIGARHLARHVVLRQRRAGGEHGVVQF